MPLKATIFLKENLLTINFTNTNNNEVEYSLNLTSKFALDLARELIINAYFLEHKIQLNNELKKSLNALLGMKE